MTELVYDVVQRALGYGTMSGWLQRLLGDTSGRALLDVGGGTGNLVPLLSPGTGYVCLDSDASKLERLKLKWPQAEAVLGDATAMPFTDKSFDDAVCVAVTHHLSDEQLHRLVHELDRVARDRVLVLDAVWEPRSLRGRLLWKIDRGSFPRAAEELNSILVSGLTPVRTERARIHHHYLLWLGRPHPD